jgi:hypothetical protein
MNSQHHKLALEQTIYDRDDFTFYKEVEDEMLNRLLDNHRTLSLAETRYSDECKLHLVDSDASATGRALACRCFNGGYWSITFRKESGNSSKEAYKLLAAEGRESGFAPNNQPRDDYLNTLERICCALYERIFPTVRSGLVIIAGRTGSAKSEITRGLIHRYIEARIKDLTQARKDDSTRKERRPHLVTFEDPIEKYYYDGEGPTTIQQYGLDYTPRQKSVDVADIKSAVNDALRQTPSIFFAGETRDESDLRELIRFAGTGHLAFTTIHAGSLAEALGNIFQATETKTPAQRSIVADRLLALVHLRRGKVKERNVVLPALWRYTAGGAKALMAEGCASLVPHSSEVPQTQRSSLGRCFFAHHLANGNQAVAALATKWDLEGI